MTEKKYITDVKYTKKYISADSLIRCINKLISKKELTDNDIELILSYISICAFEKEDLNNLAVSLKNMGLNTKEIKTKKAIGSGSESHSFLILELPNNQVYLIDPNYGKFFLEENCREEKYEIKDNNIINSPHPGYYYLKHTEHLPVAEVLIEKGYTLLDDITAKIYAESFYTTRKGPFYNFSQISNPDIDGGIYNFALRRGV